MNRKAIFFTSDWHCYHDNILKFCERPFADIEHMQRIFIRNFNSCVSSTGLCYFLGDMGGSDKLKDVMDQLNGTKILILGNHDKKFNKMHYLGFDAVFYQATLEIAGEMVTLSHCPLLDTFRENTSHIKNCCNEYWYGDDRPNLRKLASVNHGQFHLHGHIHSPNRGFSSKTLGRQFDVGMDANGYRPVNISKIESWITTTKKGEE